MTPENAIYEFLKAEADASATQSGTEVQATAYQRLESVKTVRVGNAETTLEMDYDNEVSEYDADIVLQVLNRVEDADDSGSYVSAREGVTDLAKWVVKALRTDPTLGNRVCDVNIYKAMRGWARIETAPFALVLIPLRINPLSVE